MCGIAGIYGFRGNAEMLRDRLRDMNDAMIHRGPDEEGFHVSDEIKAGLSVRRLSIVDPEHGSQPLYSEDRSVAVVCNGEIYNHRSLRRELERKGYKLRSHSDCEVLAHLYLEEGAGFLNRLNGMFALAVLDMRKGTMLLARDPVGMKHLYWGQTPDGIVFASEARAMFASGLVTPRPDWDSLSRYFTFGWIQSPGTAFDGLNRLEPGGFLMLSGENLSAGRYGFPEFEQPDPNRDIESFSDELKQLLEAAVATHLDADVPAGLFLSGGWDSSLVSLYASRRSARPLQSFSLVFPDDPASDESRYSRQVARVIGTTHREIEVRHEDVVSAAEATIAALEEPLTTSPTALNYLLAGAAGQDVKMAIGGEGADELFAGYPRFADSPLHRLRRFSPHSLWPATLPIPMEVRWSRALRFLSAPNDELAHLQLTSHLMAETFKGLFTGQPIKPSHHDPAALGTGPATRESFRNDLDVRLSVEMSGRLADGILFSHDKTSMRHSLEIRMPFLDRHVVEFAHRVPSEYKVRGAQMKRLLAGLAAELPPEVAARTKQGLAIPPNAFGDEAARKFLVDTILDTSLSTGLFDHQRLESWIAKNSAGYYSRVFQLWPLCQFCLWWNHFIEGPATRFRAVREQPCR